MEESKLKMLRTAGDSSCCGLHSIHGFWGNPSLDLDCNDAHLVENRIKRLKDDLKAIVGNRNKYNKGRPVVGMYTATTSSHQNMCDPVLMDVGFTPALVTRNPNSDNMVTLWVYDTGYKG